MSVHKANDAAADQLLNLNFRHTSTDRFDAGIHRIQRSLRANEIWRQNDSPDRFTSYLMTIVRLLV